jgi:O-antigen/teichoic acid export membrane protein
VGGRGFLLATKLVIAALIIRTCGAERFGEYSLILGILLLCEWLVDFGFGDIAVRDICHAPERQQSLLESLTSIKLVQVAISYLVLVGILLAMDHPSAVLSAGLIGGIEVLFYGAITVYKALFRVRLTMERDVLAESGGVAVLLGLLWLACANGASLQLLIGCFVAARACQFGLAWLMGRREFHLGMRADRPELRRMFRMALPVGTAGFLVAVYDQLDTLLLFELDGPRAVGFYAGGQRFFLAAIALLASLGITMYPILAAHWRLRMAEFRRCLQLGLDLVMVLAGFVFCMLQIGAGFLLALLSPEIVATGPALRVLAWVLFLRAITTLVGPVLVVVGAHSQILWTAVLAVVVKVGLLLLLIPGWGYLGAAYACLAAEAISGFLPTVIATQWFTGVRLHWGVLLRLAPAALLSIGLPSLLGLRDTAAGMLLAAALYPVAALATKAVRVAQLRSFATGIRARFPGSDRLTSHDRG